MGVFYLVEPFDDEQREWLEEAGVEIPEDAGKGRNPTPAEIREVCDALEGFGVEYKSSGKNKFWQADVTGNTKPTRNRWTLLNINNWGGSETRRYKIMFEKGDPDVIIKIVHGLSAKCGPLMIVPDSYEPIVVWAEADVKKLLKQWGN